MDIRQSSMYANYMRKIGWVVDEIDETKIFIKKLSLISIIKIQRPNRLPSEKVLNQLVKKYRVWSISLEMLKPFDDTQGKRAQDDTLKSFKINNSPYLPTKTIQIDLTASEEKIFKRFTEAKQRGVRRAIKNGVTVTQSNIQEFIKLKSKDFWPMGGFMKKDAKTLWESFSPKNAAVLIAYENEKSIAGVFLLFYESMAYYWMAASTSEGKKLFAPTLLVWEALKLSKKKKCKVFDFEGVYDERFHNATKHWQGFTKFKEGFGGKEIIFPESLIKSYGLFR